MLKGDLASTPLAPLLLHLAEDVTTGCLHVSNPADDEALVYFKNGLVYAVTVPGRRPQLGAKLVSSGALAPEALADAIEAQRTELKGWRLGELLVHLGYVDQPVVEAFIKEQVHDAIWDLIKWVEGRWRFRKGEKTREDVAPPMAVSELLQELRNRGAEWASISTIVHGPTAVPVLSTRGGGSAEMMLDPDAWSMLCKIDGQRSLAELARDCGYTHFEAAHILVALVNAGLVDIEEDLAAERASALADAPQEELYGATSVSSALAADAVASYQPDLTTSDTDDAVARLARLASEVAASAHDEDDPLEQEPADVVPFEARARFNAGNDQSFAASIAKVSAALSDVLGPASASADPFELPTDLRIRTAPRVRSEEEERKTRARQAAAAELAAAHALAEALRPSQVPESVPVAAEPADVDDVAEVVDLAAVRREAEEAARVEAERVEAERAATEEAARLEAERLEAERLEAERLEAERIAAEEAARREAEEAAERRRARRRAAREAARVEAERLAAEEAARVEAERQEAERIAAEEAARLEAERQEAERLAAEEAARLEAERAEAEAGAWAEYWAREARAADTAAEATSLLVSLSADPVHAPEPEPEPEPVADDVDEPSEVREPATVGGRSVGMYDMTDTAALLRELSSLGVEDEPPASTTPTPSRPARPATPEKKKKRGLFGF